MYFNTKSYLKNTRNHTAKHALNSHLNQKFISLRICFFSSQKQDLHRTHNQRKKSGTRHVNALQSLD